MTATQITLSPSWEDRQSCRKAVRRAWGLDYEGSEAAPTLACHSRRLASYAFVNQLV